MQLMRKFKAFEMILKHNGKVQNLFVPKEFKLFISILCLEKELLSSYLESR